MSIEQPEKQELRFKIGDTVNIPTTMRESNEPSRGWHIIDFLPANVNDDGVARYILALTREGKHLIYRRATYDDLKEANE